MYHSRGEGSATATVSTPQGLTTGLDFAMLVVCCQRACLQLDWNAVPLGSGVSKVASLLAADTAQAPLTQSQCRHSSTQLQYTHTHQQCSHSSTAQHTSTESEHEAPERWCCSTTSPAVGAAPATNADIRQWRQGLLWNRGTHGDGTRPEELHHGGRWEVCLTMFCRRFPRTISRGSYMLPS